MKRSSGSAFMLVELMFVLGLLAVVGLVATQIFVLNLRTSTRLESQHQAQMQFDQATAQLRRDVWDASSLSLQVQSVLTIGLPNGQTVNWNAGKSLQRTLTSQTQRWDALETTIAFQLRGPEVSLVLDPGGSETGGKLTLMSQSMLLQGGAK